MPLKVAKFIIKSSKLYGLHTECLRKFAVCSGNTTDLTIISVILAKSLNTSMGVVKCLESLFGHGHKFWKYNSTTSQISILFERKMVL